MRNLSKFLLLFLFLILTRFHVQSQNSEEVFPAILQENPLDCGPVCLKIIADYYDKKCTIEQISNWANLDSTGTSLLGLKVAADSLNFETIGVKISFLTLIEEIPLPAIIHWNGNHFVVIYKANHRKIWVSDPAYGKRIYSKEKFLKYWLRGQNRDKGEGIVLLFENKENP